MPTEEQFLAEHTFKEEAMEVGRRVYYTLMDKDGEYQANRTAKALALLIQKLHGKDVLNDRDIDDLLVEAIR